MEAREIVTVFVSLIVGLGAAGITAVAGARKAEQDRASDLEREARTAQKDMARALRNYQRAIVDVLGDMENELMGGSGPIEGRYDRYIEVPRAEAYHYFHLFPKDEMYLLRWPLHDEQRPYGDQYDMSRPQSTVDAIERFLGEREL